MAPRSVEERKGRLRERRRHDEPEEEVTTVDIEGLSEIVDEILFRKVFEEWSITDALVQIGSLFFFLFILLLAIFTLERRIYEGEYTNQ